MTNPRDPMPEELTKLKLDLERDKDNVTLTQVKPDSQYIEYFQSLTPVQMELLRNCGKYADFKIWLVTMKFVDEGESKDGTERFSKMINYVTQLLQVRWHCVRDVAAAMTHAPCVFSLPQGESYDEEVLTALAESRNVMMLFLQPPSLTELVCSIRDCKLLTSLQRLNLVEKNFSHIQDWFDDNVSHTTGEIISQLDAIMNKGRGLIRTVAKAGNNGEAVISLEIQFTVTKHSREVTRVMTEDQLAVRVMLCLCVCVCVFVFLFFF